MDEVTVRLVNNGTTYAPSVERLEAAVQKACEAIYRERDGYWPSELERRHIAIALLSAVC